MAKAIHWWRPLLLCCLFAALESPETALSQQVIVHPDVAVSAIDRTRARLIFTMRVNQWRDKQPVTVFVLPDDAALHQAFAKSALQVYPYQLRRTWDRQVFSGTGQAPLQVADEREMVERVRETAGAIGYISDRPAAPGVKVIEVE
jgi:ABC-type phosphate transport system substrate-binding protein